MLAAALVKSHEHWEKAHWFSSVGLGRAETQAEEQWFFKIYVIDYTIRVVLIFPTLPPSTRYPHSLWQSPPPTLSSCSWVMHVSSLATPLPMLFLTSFCLFSTYQFILLTPFTIPPIPADPHPGCHPSVLRIYESVSVLLVCSVCFLDSVVDSCEFNAILLFIVLIFFFLNKSR